MALVLSAVLMDESFYEPIHRTYTPYNQYAPIGARPSLERRVDELGSEIRDHHEEERRWHEEEREERERDRMKDSWEE